MSKLHTPNERNEKRMKIEIGEEKPGQFNEGWPGQYSIFSHLELVTGVPSALFLITTLKENGQPNVCLHAWSTFAGDGGGYFAIMPSLMQSTHTYKNILREREFCVNFMSSEYYDQCIASIRNNGEDSDEAAANGFTIEAAKTIKAPRLKEAFATLECTLVSSTDLSGKGINAMIIGRVRHAAVEESHKDVDSVSGEGGFMFNIHCPKDPKTGIGAESGLAVLKTIRKIDESV